MEYVNIINNAFNYVIKDANKFIKLAIPNIIVGLMIALTIFPIFLAYGFNYYITSYLHF